MTWLTPIWLALLLPWAAACVWSGRRATLAARVPFLTLWPAQAATAGPRRRLPPAWVMLLLAAVLLTILAAAGPAVRRAAPRLTVVVDRSPSLAGERLKSALTKLPITPATRVRVVPVPGEAFDAVGAIDAARLSPSAAPADGVLQRAVRDEVGPVVVVSDRAIDLPASVAVVRPDRRLMNAGIDRFAVTMLSPPVNGRVAQAMVTIVNAADQRRAMLRVDDVRVAIELPVPADDLKQLGADPLPSPPPAYRERGPAARDYFVDLPGIGEACEAELLDEDGRPFGDDVAADDHAYLVRTSRPARVEPRTPVSDDLARMIAVYNRRRSAGAGDAAAVAIVRDTAPTGPAVILAKAFGEPPASRPAAANVEAIDASHPVTRSADLFDIAAARRSAEGPIGDGWRTLVRGSAESAEGHRPSLLAVREAPDRQVWIGFDTDFLAQRADYVIFWTDVFDWLGGGATTYAGESVRGGLTPIKVADAALDASPGLYRDGTRTIATAMPAVRPGPPTESTAPTSATSLAAIATVADPLAVWPLAAALGCFTLALILGRRLTGF